MRIKVRPGAAVVWLAACVVAWTLAAGPLLAANVWLDFNKDAVGQAPKGGQSSGAVKVVQHPMKTTGDLSVGFIWDKAADRPEFAISPEDHKLPLRGILRYDMLIGRHGAGLEMVGLSNRNRVMFRFIIDAEGRAWTVGADEKRNQILCVAAPPDTNHWYNVCVRYDLTSRLFNVILDSYWPSGDTAAATFVSEESLDRIAFRGVGDGPGVYYLDSVRLLANEGDAVGSDGSTLPLGSYSRKFKWETPLLADPAPLSAMIVYPSAAPGGQALGEKVRAAVKARGGRDIPCVSDQVVIDQATWLVREEFLVRPIIALGNVADNKAIYALSTRFLTLANHKWPGGDKFCVRSILEPFRAEVNWIVVEASTPEGLGAGVDALCRRIEAAPADLAMKYFRELGSAKGKWAETPFRMTGIDLSKSIDEIKEQIKVKFGPSARIAPGDLYMGDAWTWLGGASPDAAKFAAGVLLMQLERDPHFLLVGHYNYDQCIKGWQVCFTSGAMDEATMNRAEAAMARTAGNPAYAPNDWFSDAVRADRGRVMSYDTGRHWLATASNYLCGSDYVLSHCRLNPVTRAIVEDYDLAFRTAAKRITDTYRPRVETSEIGDCNAMILNFMALTGNMSYMRQGTLSRAAEFYLAMNNNLGCYVGEGAYIGSGLGANLPGKIVVGAAAYYNRDPEFQWLYRHFVGTEWCCTAGINPVFDDEAPEAFPRRYIGLHVLPFDPNNYRTMTVAGVLPEEWRLTFTRPLTEPIESLYDAATFRDGFTPETGFLTMYGSQCSQIMLANTVPQYTDLGQTLLFCSTQFEDRWCRNAAMASNGLPCQPTSGCIKNAAVSSEAVSAISSTDPFNGNTQATRTIMHRAGHYFVVFDRFKATADDDYTFAARWRSPYPAAMEGSTWVEQAPCGVRLRLMPADAIPQESVQEDFDGEYRPYILTQHKQAHLRAGETATLRSVFYASSDARPDQCAVRPADANCMFVRGGGKGWDETAVIGLGSSPACLPQVDIKADVFYVSGEDLVAANATCVKVGGKDLMDAPGPANVVLKIKDQNVAAALGAAFAAAKPVSTEQAAPAKEYGLRTLWQNSDAVHAPGQYRVASATADRPSWSFSTVDKVVDPNRIIGVAAPHNGISWRSSQGPVKLVLDLGEVKSVGAIRLIGTIANSYCRKFAWNDGDMAVAVAYSDDNFARDIREDKSAVATFNEFNLPRVHYVWAARFPQLTIKTAARARYIRLTMTSRTEDVTLQKVIVEDSQPDKTLFCELKAADLDGNGTDELLVRTANNELLAIGPDGKKRWSHRLGGQIVAWDAQDLDGDKKAEAIVYTSDDACAVFNGDGTQRWREDFYERSKQGPEEKWQRWFSQYMFTTLTAWRPDAAGHKEVIGWPKNPVAGIRQDGGKLTVTEYKDMGYAQAAVADSKVLGKEVMVMCGQQLTVKDTTCNTLVNHYMKGPLAGNGDFPVFVAAAAVAEEKQKGFLGLNPASVCWAPADPRDKGWDEFSEVTITSYLLKDLDGDGASELLIGYKDGFVRVYRLSDGKILGKLCAGAPVTGLAAMGNQFVVATRDNVRAYDSALKETGLLNIQAVSVVLLKGKEPTVAVVDQTGTVRAIRP